MRIGFTIIYNGAHHLEHNDWGCRLPKMLDYWVIVEGAADNGGSTSWCKRIDDPHNSTDGTFEITGGLAGRHKNVTCIGMAGRKWKSKDEMVNAAIKHINSTMKNGNIVPSFKWHFKNQCEPVFLWEIDSDEIWDVKDMASAEIEIINTGADCGCFHANHFVGKGIVARGTWGEGNDPTDPLKNAYRRLWRWKGQMFETHEPPVLEGGNGKEVLLPQRFNHYSYYFEKDVIFKSKYYQGYEELHTKWLDLQKETVFPQPISRLIGGYWGNTETVIDRI